MRSRHPILALVLAPTAAIADVQVGASGFVVKHEATLDAPPARVYEALVRQIGSWWNPSHTYTANSGNLSLDTRPGGCFCETFPEGGGVEHLRVVYVAPGRELRLAGALGPLQLSGLAGSLRWRLSDAAGGTKLELTYSVGGFMEGGFTEIAPAVEAMLGDQVARLVRFVTTGAPTAE
ncbi:MAG: SRPBCC domain-containing protein [Pseudomonadota bacterium]|jgi:Uncharacterized conserved protein|nr:MAG: ATPase [Pseudomonadota bacterium]